MKNQAKRAKKLAKKRALRKDFERKRNINRQPPSELKEIKKDIFIPCHEENGELKKDSKGNVIMRTVVRKKIKRVKKTLKDKNGKMYLIVPMPSSKKFKIGLKDIKKRKIDAMKVPQTAS